MNFLTDWLSSLGQSARDRTPPGPAIADRPQRLSFHEKPYQAPAFKPSTPAASAASLAAPQTVFEKAPSSGYVPSAVVTSALTREGWAVPAAPTAAPAKIPSSLVMAEDGTYIRPSHNYMMNADDLKYVSWLGTELGAPAPTLGSGSAAPGTLDELRLEGGQTRVGAMTREQFEALTPQQQAGVRFNTMLVEATKSDFKRWGDEHDDPNLKQEAIQAHRDEVEALFGKGRGSDVYAPLTLKLVKDLNIDVRGQDFDEFLSLERGLTADQLANVPENFSVAPIQTLAEGQDEFQNQKEFVGVRGEANARILSLSAIEAAGKYLDSIMSNAATAAPTAGQYISRRYANGGPLMGWGVEGDFEGNDALRNKGYQDLYGVLRNRDEKNPMAVIMAELEGGQFNDAQYADFWSYVNERLARDEQLELTDGGRTPAQVRALMDKGA